MAYDEKLAELEKRIQDIEEFIRPPKGPGGGPGIILTNWDMIPPEFEERLAKVEAFVSAIESNGGAPGIYQRLSDIEKKLNTQKATKMKPLKKAEA